MKNLAILQARMSSSRLPGKVMKQVNGKPLIYWQILRTRMSSINDLVVATTSDRSDDVLANYLHTIGVRVFRGDLDDVFSRFIAILDVENPDYFLRLTADCPLVMPSLIDEMIKKFESVKPDYLSNTLQPTFPDGLDIEIIFSPAFARLKLIKLNNLELEHVTLGMYSRPTEFKLLNYSLDQDLSGLRWTVDYPEDLNFILSVYKEFEGRETHFDISDILRQLNSGKIKHNLVPGNLRNIQTSNYQLGESL
jgi:spore coat polysaccharide biosynthesis protein SpsF